MIPIPITVVIIWWKGRFSGKHVLLAKILLHVLNLRYSPKCHISCLGKHNWVQVMPNPFKKMLTLNTNSTTQFNLMFTVGSENKVALIEIWPAMESWEQLLPRSRRLYWSVSGLLSFMHLTNSTCSLSVVTSQRPTSGKNSRHRQKYSSEVLMAVFWIFQVLPELNNFLVTRFLTNSRAFFDKFSEMAVATT